MARLSHNYYINLQSNKMISKENSRNTVSYTIQLTKKRVLCPGDSRYFVFLFLVFLFSVPSAVARIMSLLPEKIDNFWNWGEGGGEERADGTSRSLSRFRGSRARPQKRACSQSGRFAGKQLTENPLWAVMHARGQTIKKLSSPTHENFYVQSEWWFCMSVGLSNESTSFN